MRRLVRVLTALAIGAACWVIVLSGSVASATVAAWGSHGDGDAHPAHSPAPYCPPTTRPPTTRPYQRPPDTRPPYTRPPYTRPPVTHPPVTKPPVTKPPVTGPGSKPQSNGPPVTLPPPTVPVAVPTAGAPATTVAATDVAPLDTFDTFQAFVKGIEANAASDRARARAARVPLVVPALPTPAPIISQLTPPPALLPPGPLFHDSPAPLLPLNASGLRTARSFVFLFGLSALALGFLAVRARLARRNHAFVSAALDEHGDYVEFV